MHFLLTIFFSNIFFLYFKIISLLLLLLVGELKAVSLEMD